MKLDAVPPGFEKMTAGELDYVNERTRAELAIWCERELRGLSPVRAQDMLINTEKVAHDPFVRWAVYKGWLSKDFTKVLSAGYKTAAAFLRR